MPRISRRDLASLADLEAGLHRVSGRAEPAFRMALLRLRELTEALAAGLVLFDGWGPAEESCVVETSCLRTDVTDGGWLGRIGHPVTHGRAGRLHVARAVLADGPAVIGIVGLAGVRQLTRKQTQVLVRLAPSFRHRARIERLLQGRSFARSALGAALAEVDGAAILLSARGEVDLRNPAGHERLASGGSAFSGALRAATRKTGAQSPAPLFVQRIGDARRTDGFLVLERQSDRKSGAAADPEPTWNLTPRHRAVVELVAQGLSNRQVAHALGIAERTVETHLTAIFERARVTSRSELIARLLTR